MSVNTALVSVDTSLVSVNTFLVSEDQFSLGDPNVFVRRIESSFRRQSISKSALVSLAVVLRTCTCRHVYWRCGITPGLQVSWHVFVCLARSVLVSTVRKLGQRCVAAPLLRVFFFLSVFRVCPTFAVMLLLLGAVCSVSLVLAQFEKTLV